MRVVVVYKDATDYTRAVDSFREDFSRQTGRVLEALNPESREGELFCRTYDIVEYPTVIALSNSGEMQNMWTGPLMPTISEVSYYAAQD
jgi:hypothetical protein